MPESSTLERPLFSAVLTSYNTGALLSDSYASACREAALCALQGIDVEIILVDDHSGDAHTLALLDQLERSGDPVRVVRLGRNQGVSSARNAGAAAAHGLWLAFLDGDDAWTEGTLLAHARAIALHPTLRWFSCDHQRMDAKGALIAGSVRRNQGIARHLEQALPAPDAAATVIVVPRPIEEALHEFLCHVDSTVIHRQSFRNVGGFDASLRSAEDHDLWLRLAEHFDLGYAGRVGALYRTTANSITTSTSLPHPHLPLVYQRAASRFKHVRHQRHPVGLAQLATARWRQTVLENVHHCRRTHDFAEAARQARWLVQHDRWHLGGWKHWIAARLNRA